MATTVFTVTRFQHAGDEEIEPSERVYRRRETALTDIERATQGEVDEGYYTRKIVDIDGATTEVQFHDGPVLEFTYTITAAQLD